MKNLPEHTPKADAWEKILGQGDFDAQCSRLLSDLPIYSPKASSWNRIETALDKKRTLSPWIYWAAASAVMGLLLGVGMFNWSFENKKGQMLSSIDSAKEEQVFAPEETEESTTISATETIPTASEKKQTKRQATEAIQIQKIALPDIKFSPAESLSLALPDTPLAESSPPPTLHQVRISWTKIKPSMQVRTTFGRMDSEQPDKQQASTPKVEHLSIDINN